MRTTLVLGIAVLGAACGGGGGGGNDWSKKAVKPVTGTIEGAAFSIEVPEGMRQKTDPKSLELDFLVDGRVFTPNLTIRQGGFAHTVDDYVKGEPKVATWLRKEATADGYIVSYENASYPGKEDYIVYSLKKVGDKEWTCSARVTRWSKDDKVKDKVPLVEKMCLSLKPS